MTRWTHMESSHHPCEHYGRIQTPKAGWRPCWIPFHIIECPWSRQPEPQRGTGPLTLHQHSASTISMMWRLRQHPNSGYDVWLEPLWAATTLQVADTISLPCISTHQRAPPPLYGMLVQHCKEQKSSHPIQRSAKQAADRRPS